MVHSPDTYVNVHVLIAFSYVCSHSVNSYDHFNDETRGGKRGKCPLYDNVEERHEQEILRAAEAARKKLREENPNLQDEDLEIQFSEDVKRREEARRQQAQPAHLGRIPVHRPPPPAAPVQQRHHLRLPQTNVDRR
jgi:TRIAD3 protein (E3 ubiquitin-protein ligase RNF216)